MLSRMGKKRRERSQDSILELNDTDVEDELAKNWLSNEIAGEANDKKRRKDIKNYDAKHMCIVGLERILAITHGDDFESLPLSSVNSQLKLVSMYYQRFFEESTKSQALSAKDIVDQQKLMDKIDSLHLSLNSVLESRIKELQLSEISCQPNSTMHVTLPHVPDQGVKVKKMEIEKFAGKDHDWPQFKAQFEKCFHRRTDMSDSTKFYHLMAHLAPQSEAYNTINGMNLHYDQAWAKLCDAYDQWMEAL